MNDEELLGRITYNPSILVEINYSWNADSGYR
jgi:hypothetical protein